MRITEHPVLPFIKQKKITIYYGGEPIEAAEGEPVAAALLASGIRALRTTVKYREPRGVFCAIGRCTDCMMIVDGVPNTRTCVTAARDGMRVERQECLVSPEPPADTRADTMAGRGAETGADTIAGRGSDTDTETDGADA